MLESGEKILAMNIENRKDYIEKFNKLVEEAKNNESNNSSESDELICPRCGNKLVLRTAKKGQNIGNQFYGCSGYPKCKYIKNLPS